MQDYIETLEEVFKENACPKNAIKQAKYMKNHFLFYGINSPNRRLLTKPFLIKASLPSKDDSILIIKSLWKKPEREYQYFALDLALKHLKHFEENDLAFFEYLITHKSWWDTIDIIAPKLVGTYFKNFPHKRNNTIDKWIASNNLWLHRSSILFPMKYKKELDTDYLSFVIKKFIGSKEFFINKAIGWVLREYAYVNPKWVIAFCENHQLHSLSEREALRVLKKRGLL